MRVIRPLVFVRESALRLFATEVKLPIIEENCPACFDAPTVRFVLLHMSLVLYISLLLHMSPLLYWVGSSGVAAMHTHSTTRKLTEGTMPCLLFFIFV